MSLTSKRNIRLRSRGVVVDAAQSFGRSPASWRICRFCSVGHGEQGLSFEGCQLSLEFLQALHGVVPALFEGRRDEAIGGIDGFVSAFREVHVVTRSLDPHSPL